jgi:hypothetical protein
MAEITSTRQRLQEFLLKNPDYEVSTEPIYMPALDGWLVRTSVTNFIDGKPRIFQGASFRKIEYNSPFTALETAETVSLGRCLGKMGFGIDQEFATIDEMSGLPITQIDPIIIEEKIKKAEFVKQVEPDHHDDVVAAKLAASEGDIEKVQEIISDVKEVIPTEEVLINVPDKDETTGKRNFKEKANKQMFEDLKKVGCTKENIMEWVVECGMPYTTYEEFLRKAEKNEIVDFYIHLTTANEN